MKIALIIIAAVAVILAVYIAATYNSLVKLVAWLMNEGGLDTSHVIRHYDITGKECPLYYVNNQEAWLTFKADVASYTPNN